jgi:cytochrome P450
MTFYEPLSIVPKHLMLVALVPHRLLSFPLWPERSVRVRRAAREFKRHMIELLEKEKKASTQGMRGRADPMSALLAASDAARGSAEEASSTKTKASTEDPAKAGLSDEETLENISIFSLAGHESTTTTLSYPISLPSTSPQYQD